MKEIPQNVSESFKRLNPHLYGVRAVEANQPKSIAAQALDGGGSQLKNCAQSLSLCVTLVVLHRRLLDSDNLQGACKPLRDAIAKSLGIDDADSRINWEYSQQKTQGAQGVVVKIECSP